MSIDGKNAAQDAFLLGDALARQGDLFSARGALQTAISFNDPTSLDSGAIKVHYKLQSASFRAKPVRIVRLYRTLRRRF